MKLHPLATLFPEMSTDEFRGFLEDVRLHGVREPAWTFRGQIVDGRHRIRACDELGVPCPTREYAGQEEDLLPFVLSLNLKRRHLNESQRAMIAARLANMENGSNQHAKKVGGQICPPTPVSTSQAAAMLNISASSVKAAKSVIESGSKQLIAAVDRGEIAVSVACKATALPEKAQQAALSEPTPAAKKRAISSAVTSARVTPAIEPDDECCTVADLAKLVASGQKFGCIYADPPWQYGNQGTRAATDNHYGTMTVEEIVALPVGDLAAEQSHLWLWTTNGFLFECPKLFAAWGFEFKSSYVWVKPQMGIGNYLRNSHEILLLATRGGLVGQAKDVKSWGEFDRTEHSAKPERIRLDVVERLSPGPRLELFGRRVAPGWTVWGNQISRTMFDTNVREIR